MGAVIAYGIFIAHIAAYHEQYSNIGMTFALTYVIKRWVKSWSKDDADIIGIGGYALTVGEFAKLIKDIKTTSFQGNAVDSGKIMGGVLGKSVDWIKDLIVK